MSEESAIADQHPTSGVATEIEPVLLTTPFITNVWPVCKNCDRILFHTPKREHPELCWDCWREKYSKDIDKHCNNDVKLPPRKKVKVVPRSNEE